MNSYSKDARYHSARFVPDESVHGHEAGRRSVHGARHHVPFQVGAAVAQV